MVVVIPAILVMPVIDIDYSMGLRFKIDIMYNIREFFASNQYGHATHIN